MSLSLDQVLNKIKKLTRLATSDNIHEAALAASRAAAIMQEYQIEEAAISNFVEEDKEQVEEYSLEHEDPLSSNSKEKRIRKKTHWRMSVAAGCAIVCNCQTFWYGAYIRFIGRKSDVQAARYLYDLIAPQVDRLAEQIWHQTYEVVDFDRQMTTFEAPNRKSWLHAFRLGCAKEIRRRMNKQHFERWMELERQAKKGQQPLNDANSGQALMIINSRLSKVSDFEKTLGLKFIPGPSLTDYSGYSAGQQAGSRVNIGGASRGSLPSPKKQVT